MRSIALTLVLLVLCSSIALAKPEVVLNIPEYTLRLVEGKTVLKEYEVAVGTSIEQTLVGKFAVFFKEKNPTWYPASGFVDKTPVPPGPDNPLGSRWIEYAPAFGIHGTHKVWTVDYPVSGGCVRMYNPDVEEFYELVEIGTSVTVVYETITMVEKKDGLYVKIFSDIYEKGTTSREKYLAMIVPFFERYQLIGEPAWPVKVDFAQIYERKIGILKSGIK
ncbi:MAG: L,D-transpeptidase [Negativicutes bacterium]